MYQQRRKLTFNLDVDLFHRLKIAAAALDEDMVTIVEQAIARELGVLEQEVTANLRMKLNPHNPNDPQL